MQVTYVLVRVISSKARQQKEIESGRVEMVVLSYVGSLEKVL
jgi:hypothetical protein